MRRIGRLHAGAGSRARARALIGRRGFGLLLSALCLFVVVGVTAALADEAPSSEISSSFLQEAAEAPEVVAAEITDPQAAEELPHQDLERDEAVELTEAVFDPILEDAVGPIQGLEVEEYLGDNAAIALGGTSAESPVEINRGSGGDSVATGEPVLLESTLPLRTEGPDGSKEPVDLSLEVSGDVLQPKAPLFEVELPQEIGDGIQLPEAGIKIELPEAPSERAPSILNETVATYPNVATDTDFSAVPTPTGFETLTTLRSPGAPHDQTFQLSLPRGATLLQAGEGAEVERDGKTILKALPPSAIDAAGANVPVSLEVNGNSLILTASPDASTQFPVLVDPLFEAYDWYYFQAQTGQNTWYPNSNRVGLEPSHDNWGLYIRARHEFPYSSGSQAEWAYYPPRFKEEQAQGRSLTSFVQRLTLWHLAFVTQPGGAFAPYMFAGIWGSQGWAGKPGGYAVWSYAGNLAPFYMNAPGNGMLVEFENGEPGKRDETAQMGIFGLASTENVPQTTQSRLASAGAAAVEVGDLKAPKSADASYASSWVDQTATAPLTALVEDTGLGVKNIGFDLPWKGPKVVPHGCAGTVGSPCPLNWTATLPANQYNPAEMPQGFVYVPIDAEDVLGNKATHGSSKATLKVDHTKPSLALSGTLTEQAKVGTTAPQYSLKYSASDGDAAAAEALPTFGVAGTGSGQFLRPGGVAVDAVGNVFVSDRLNNRVMKFDSSGKFLSQFGTTGSGNGQFSDNRGIAVSSNGTIWVADWGNRRVQQFSASGIFLRKIDLGGSSNPYAVATGPNEMLWIVDQTAKKVWKYKEDGTSLGPAKDGPDLINPVGAAVDQQGNVWVIDQASEKIRRFNSAGEFNFEFGTAGTGPGQISHPRGIAIAPSGHILITDEAHRVQEFKTTGAYNQRQFGTNGSGAGQLFEPQGLAMGPGNKVYVADAGNKRIAPWAHADYDLQSGATSTEVKVDGNLPVPKFTQSCEDSCTINREWTLNADNYAVGQHNVQVTATDGVGLSTTQSLTIETHGDLKDPTVALTGSMTEQGTLGTTRPRYILKVGATDPGSAEERKSGVASTTVKVDGSAVDTASPGCPAGGCSISREWTLNSNSYSVGAHTVQVTATDAAGRVTTKSLSITINRDTTPPQLTAPNSFFTAPEGWVEQKTYAYGPYAFDPNGYGVTSMVLKIDGAVIKNHGQLCPDGACGINPVSTVDMAPYAGGAHKAELIATDGAGNAAKKTWTVNVDPDGNISAGEAEDTLEAVEATDPDAALIAPNSQVIDPAERADGNDPLVVKEGGSFTVSGVPVASQFTSNPSEGIAIPTPDTDFQIEPIGGTAGGGTVISGGSAAVTPNTNTHIDTVIRPVFSGVTNFQVIRAPQAAETFSWKVNIYPGQTLELVDSQTAQVVNKDGTSVMMISAESARDATGKAVPTSLQVLGSNAIQLTVSHKGGNYAYPVSAGPSFEVGYSTVRVELPPELIPSTGEDEVWGGYTYVSPPEPINAEDTEATASGLQPVKKHFLWVMCSHLAGYFEEPVSPLIDWEDECGNPFKNTHGHEVAYRVGLHGRYLIKQSGKSSTVWHEGGPNDRIGCAAQAANGQWPPHPLEPSLSHHQRKAWVDQCVWWGETSGGNGGAKALWGQHITPAGRFMGESRGGCGDQCGGTPNPWEQFELPPMAIYLWASGHIGYHETNCIDCY